MFFVVLRCCSLLLGLLSQVVEEGTDRPPEMMSRWCIGQGTRSYFRREQKMVWCAKKKRKRKEKFKKSIEKKVVFYSELMFRRRYESRVFVGLAVVRVRCRR